MQLGTNSTATTLGSTSTGTTINGSALTLDSVGATTNNAGAVSYTYQATGGVCQFATTNGWLILSIGTDTLIQATSADLILRTSTSGGVKLEPVSTVTIGSGAAGVDYILKLDGQNTDCTLKWMEGEAELRISADDATNFLAIETDGTVRFGGTATVFNDIVINLSAARVPAANAPTWSSFISNLNSFTYGVNDFQEFTSEITHSYKEGSNILFHLHGATNGLEGVDKTIKFEIEYELVDNQTSGDLGDTYTGTTIINAEITIPANTTDITAWVIDVGTDTTGNFLQGATLVGRIRRIASSGVEPAADPFVQQIGVHVEEDTVGSRTELTK